MQLTEHVTSLINRRVPKCAVAGSADAHGIRYLHPTKGWKSVSWKRVGVKPYV